MVMDMLAINMCVDGENVAPLREPHGKLHPQAVGLSRRDLVRLVKLLLQAL